MAYKINYNIPDNISIARETCREGKAQIRREKSGNRIGIMKGVRQGDILSQVMFTNVVEEIFKKIISKLTSISMQLD